MGVGSIQKVDAEVGQPASPSRHSLHRVLGGAEFGYSWLKVSKRKVTGLGVSLHTSQQAGPSLSPGGAGQQAGLV